jgi:aminocarboxymuconate-semialdehyde decarboxylase
MKLDIFNHFLPAEIFAKWQEVAPDIAALKIFRARRELYDLDAHLKVCDRFDDYQQVLSLANPPIEMLGPPDQTPALARLANDALSAITQRYRDRFPGFIAAVPMNNPDAAIKEAERAVNDLNACGIQVYTNVNGKPLSAPEYYGLFETMARLDLPVWIHPVRGPNHPDYPTEDHSEAEVWFTFGWPYETSACVTRLIWAGIYDKLPGLKLITHHMGAMIPYFAEKIALGFTQIFGGDPSRNPSAEKAGLKKLPIEYYRMLYADTALNGNAPATACGHAFFGTGHCLFATDAPFDFNGGRHLIGGAIKAIDALAITPAERAQIYQGNARRLLKLM